MSEFTAEISPLALSILELLDEQPMHPYQLASTMRDRHHDEFIRLNFGSLYHTVDSLEKNGWIVPVEKEKEGRRPERTIYQLTETGRRLLVEVVSDLLARPKREYPQFSAGLMFMHHLSGEDAARRLQERATALRSHVNKLTGIMAELRADGVTRLALIELAHKIAMLEAERSWVSSLESEIISGKLKWAVGIDSSNERLRRRHGAGSQ